MDDGLGVKQELPAGLRRTDLHSGGYGRRPTPDGKFVYVDADGTGLIDLSELERVRRLVIPPAWSDVWISRDPLGHIQATGIDSRGRRQYRYQELWRAERDVEKFAHMLLFARSLPQLRRACSLALARPHLDRDRVSACAVRVTELGLFRIGNERYAREDHTYGVTSLEKRHVRVGPQQAVFDYTAKFGKRRTVRIVDPDVLHTLRALKRQTEQAEPPLFIYRHNGRWHHLTTEELGGFVRQHAGGHFTVKEFRTWNATLLMALALTSVPPTDSLRLRRRAVVAGVREVAAWLGDTPAVARSSYIDPALAEHFESTGGLGDLVPAPCALPVPEDVERSVLETVVQLHAARTDVHGAGVGA